MHCYFRHTGLKIVGTVMNDKLKMWRDKAGLSQQEVAERAGENVLTQKQVSRIEQAPLSQNLELVLAYLRIVAPEKIQEFITDCLHAQLNTSSLNQNYTQQKENMMRNKKELIQYLENSIATLSNTSNPFIKNSSIAKDIAELKDNLKDIHAKPVLSAMGPSDAGKSTLLNYILGSEILPAKWQPATCLVTLLMHTQDKPNYLDAHKSVFIFKTGFKPHMIFDQKMLADYLIDSGGKELIKTYGEKDENDNVLNPQAYMVVVFESFPILENIWLLDTPGQLIEPEMYDDIEGSSSEEILNDKAKAMSAISLVDGLIFASATTKFMRDEDPYFLQNILMHKVPLEGDKPLANLIILKTHSYDQITAEANNATFRTAANHLTKTFSQTLYDEWEHQLNHPSHPQKLQRPDAAVWASRMLPFFRENNRYCEDFDARLKEVINYLLANRTALINSRVETINKRIHHRIALALQELQQSSRSVQEKKEDIERQDARFREGSGALIARFTEISNQCPRYAEEDIERIRDIFYSLCNEESMYRFIDNQFEDKDEAKRAINKALGNHFESKFRRVMEESTRRFSLEVESVVQAWQKIVPSAHGAASEGMPQTDISLSATSDFDAYSAFVGGMAGLTSFGAMAGYVATISSNLGAYILVGKAAGVLTSLGITSSVTTLPTLVAATGGPVAWGVAIAAVVGLLVYRLFANWKKALAKSVVKGLESSSTLSNVETDITRYWQDSRKALAASVDSLKAETDAFIKHLYSEANIEYQQQDIAEAGQILTTIKNNLGGEAK
ncbi:dynamin family protein [Atlantibacter subterraneus]|nr:dynamin family protein [Atlantibacter subterranea]